MANDKDFILKNAVEVGGSTKVTIGDAPASGSVTVGYDISAASYDSVSFSVAGQDTFPAGLAFNNDGTKMYMVGTSSDSVYQYTLSTAFDLSTASYDSVSFSVSSQDTIPSDIRFNSDGTKMYVSGFSSDSVHQYSLSSAFDLSTASYDSVSFSVAGQDTNPFDITFNNDGTKMYITGSGNDSIYQYTTGSTLTTETFDTSTGNYFTHTPSADSEYGFSNAGDVQTFQLEVTGAVKGYELSGAAYDSVSFSVGGQETNPHGLFLKPDGTKLYITGYNGDSVDEYDLSTAWDISSASASQVFYVGSQDTVPTDVFFKSDGTKMYICGYNDQDINEYSLSTAWDISTASYLQNFSISSQDTLVTGVFFKPDGTKMYIAGDTNNSVFQYGLTTAWDISTASYESKSVASQGTAPQQLSFNNDGTKLLILDSSGTDSVYQYSCSTAYDVSTATYNSVSFAVNSQDTTPTGLFFKDDGMKMYVLGDVSNTIYQYSTGSAYTVTYDSTIQFGGGTAPDSPLANETDVLTFSTRDGGTTYQAAQAIDGAV